MDPIFQLHVIRRPEDVPPFDRHWIDVAILDMHHGVPSIGHDALAAAVEDAARDARIQLGAEGFGVRALSYDVRRSHRIPENPGRFQLYVGTGGPGHLDPAFNDGIRPESQGITEDPAWQRPLFQLFDRIQSDKEAALLAVCHTFGLLCRWAGIAEPVLRGREKNGKSAGICQNVLSDEGVCHPWFSGFSHQLPDGRHHRTVESRLFDLVKTGRNAAGVTAIAYESGSTDVLTMVEFAPAANGGAPRMFAVNHHPEVSGGGRQRQLIEQMLLRGSVSLKWYEERKQTLDALFADPQVRRQVELTARYTFLDPLRHHFRRIVSVRSAELRTS